MPALIYWSWSFRLVPPEPHHLSRGGRRSLLVGGGRTDILQFQALDVRSNPLADAK